VFVAGDVVLGQDFSDSQTGVSHAESTAAGVRLGADYAITPHLRTGALFDYHHTEATLDAQKSTATVDTYMPGVYASYADQGWFANAIATYGFNNYSQGRSIAIAGFDGTANSSPTGDQILGNLDGGYDFHSGRWTFGPTAGLKYVHLDVNSYTETGLPGANLDVNRDEADSLRSRVGGRVSYVFHSAGMIFTPHLDASWQHEFLDQGRGITSQFDGVDAGTFVVTTQNPSRESALVNLGFDSEINRDLTVFTNYTVQAGQDNYFGQAVQAGVKIGF
jgi:fibronectin-binding autotransporter adhesin